MESVYLQLKNATGSNAKKDILLSLRGNTAILQAFRLCYDPELNYYIKSIPNPSSYGDMLFNESFPIFQKLTKMLSDKVIAGKVATQNVRAFLSGCTEETARIYTLILKRDLDIGINVSTFNKVYGDDFIKVFTVQLSNKYKEGKKYNTPYFFSSPKLDGLRGFTDDNYMKSRTGKIFYGLEHILDETSDVRRAYGFKFTDGELFTRDVPFQTIQSYVTTRKDINEDDKKAIKYHIFAVGGDWKDTAEMIQAMESVDWTRFSNLVMTPYRKVNNNHADIMAEMAYYFSQGYEGAMLRNPHVWYDWKRSDNLIKVKPFNESDFVVVGFERGDEDGRNSDTLGSIIVEGVYEGKMIRSNAFGFSDELKDEIWNNQAKYKGRIAEISFQNVTDREIDGYWSLRFGTFRKWKMDR